MPRPRIAINCDVDPGPGVRFRRKATLYEPYIRSIVDAGGLPLLVPPSPAAVLREYLELADGILFTGGDDYPPSLYGQKRHPKVEEQEPERTESDLELMRLTLRSSKPSLGICAGLQLLNIAAGGALIQHLPEAAKHRSGDFRRDTAHPVELYEGTALRELFGADSIRVNSSHHQAADPLKLGAGLKVAARAPDGTIEALELEDPKDRFFLFVQWHPERIDDRKHNRKLFSAFVEACKK